MATMHCRHTEDAQCTCRCRCVNLLHRGNNARQAAQHQLRGATCALRSVWGTYTYWSRPGRRRRFQTHRYAHCRTRGSWKDREAKTGFSALGFSGPSRTTAASGQSGGTHKCASARVRTGRPPCQILAWPQACCSGQDIPDARRAGRYQPQGSFTVHAGIHRADLRTGVEPHARCMVSATAARKGCC